MEPEVDDGDDIWRLMGFKLSELCRVILKEPEEPEEHEEEEEPTEEPEVKPLSKTTAAEPIRERQSNRVSEFSRLPPTNTGESVTCVRGGSTGVTDDTEQLTNRVKHDRAVAFGRRPEATSQRDVGDVSGEPRCGGGINLDGVSRDRTEPSADGHGQRKPVAFVSPFTADCPHDREQANDQVDLRRGQTKHVVQGRAVDDVSDYDTVKSKAGGDLACPFVWQNGAVGGRSRDADAVVVVGNHVDVTNVESRTVGVVGCVTGTDGDSVLLTSAGSRAKDDRHSTVNDAQQNGGNEGGGVISSRSGKKQKSSKSREAKEKKKGKKHKKGKKTSPWDCCGSHKASEQNILEQEMEGTSVIPIRHTAIDSTTIYASNDTHDVMYSEGIIEIPTGVHNGGLDLAKVRSQENSVEENQPIGDAATGSSRPSEVEEILQHAQEVDKYVREIKTQHYLTYGSADVGTSDVSKADVITTDGSDVKLTGDSPNDNSSVRSDGSSSAVATAETGDVTSPGACDSLAESYADPVRRPARTKRGKLRQIVELNRGVSEEHRVVEIQVVPASDCGRTDIQALIESTEAINVDALVDESLRQCLASMTFARPDYRPPAEDSGTDDNGDVPAKRRKREEGDNGSDAAEGRGSGFPITRSCEGDFTQQEPLPDQGNVTTIPGKDVSPGDMPTTGDQLDVEYASNEGSGETEVHKHRQVRSPAHTDEVTDVAGMPGHVDTGARRASGSLSDDILFDEGYRVDDARELEMDAVSDEISLASFNTVIAVEATLASTEPRQADVDAKVDEFRQATESRQADRTTETVSTDKDYATTTMASEVNTASADFEKAGDTVADKETTEDAIAVNGTTDDANADKETTDDATAVNGTTDDATADKETTDDANAVNGTTDDANADKETTDDATAVNGTTDDATADKETTDNDFDERSGELSTEATGRQDDRAHTRGSSLPQSERTERFEYEVRGQVVETTRPASTRESFRDSAPLSRGSSVDRCETFECEVRKQLHRPSVTSGDPDADPRAPEVDELRTHSPAGLSRDTTTPESDAAAEIELKIVESDDDGDNDVVAATSRDTHARLYTLENTSDDYDVTRSHDNVEAYGLDSEESDSDTGRGCERESGNFYAADGREKTARAPVSDVIAFNENAGNSRTRSYSGGSATSSQTDNDFDALALEYEKMPCDNDVDESTDVTARNGEFQNDVIMDKETDVSFGVATDEIHEHSADDRQYVVTSTSDTEDIPRDYDTMLPAQQNQALQGAVIPGGCTSMITPIIVITEYCEPTSDSASYEGTFDLDDCQSGACNMNVDDVKSVDDVSEGDYSPNRCEQDNEDNMYENTREPVKDDGDETRGGSTGSSSDLDESAPHKQPGATDDDVDVELLTSDSDDVDVVSDNKEDNASADVPDAVDVSEPEVRRRHVGGASAAAATTPEGATFAEQAPRQTAPNPPERATALPRQPEAASAVVGRRGQDFLSDLLVEKACLEGFFSNIGMCRLVSRWSVPQLCSRSSCSIVLTLTVCFLVAPYALGDGPLRTG